MRNLILTGGIFHPFNESSRALQKILMKEGIESEITEDIEFGLKKIGEGDFNLLTVYALRWSMKNGSKYNHTVINGNIIFQLQDKKIYVNF